MDVIFSWRMEAKPRHQLRPGLGRPGSHLLFTPIRVAERRGFLSRFGFLPDNRLDAEKLQAKNQFHQKQAVEMPGYGKHGKP